MPGLRAPRTSGRDFKKIFKKLWSSIRGARQVTDGIKVWTLLQVPFHRFALVRRLNRFLLIAAVRWMTWREGVRLPIAWFTAPHLPAIGFTSIRLFRMRVSLVAKRVRLGVIGCNGSVRPSRRVLRPLLGMTGTRAGHEEKSSS